MTKVKITVTVTREIELDPTLYDGDVSNEFMLEQERKYADDLFYEWSASEDTKWDIKAELIDE